MIKYIYILLIIALSSSNVLFAGETGPEPRIARTYTIGVVRDTNNCMLEITNEIVRNQYKIIYYDALDDPWAAVTHLKLDFLIYKSGTEITVLINKGAPAMGFNLANLDGFCLAPIYYIWRKTKKLNTRELDGEIDSLSVESALATINNLLDQFNKNPDNSMTSLELSKLYYGIKEYKKQYEYLKKAEDLDPLNCEILIALGNYFKREKDYPSAIGKYSKCLDNPVNSNIANYNIGNVYREMGEKDSALSYYAKVHSQSHLFDEATEKVIEIENYEPNIFNRPLLSGFLALLLIIAGIFFYRKNKGIILIRGVKRTSIWDKFIHLPEKFKDIILLFSFILAISPFFSGMDFGFFKIPVEINVGYYGVIFFILILLLLLKILPEKDKTDENV